MNRTVPRPIGVRKWRGGVNHDSSGYTLLYTPGHPRAINGRYVREQVLVVELAIQRELPASAVVHHVNETKADNCNENLVACEDQRYHMLLHLRTRALKASGHADYRQCRFCHRWDDPRNLFLRPRIAAFHRPCRNAQLRGEAVC